MKTSDQISLLQECYRDRFALMMRHVEGAKVVSDYEFNNTYQYIIAREEAHIAWVRDAILDLGGDVPTQITPLPVPAGVQGRSKAGNAAAAQAGVIEDDIRQAEAFVERWRPRLPTVSNARHCNVLKVILGEVLEHKRFFEQAKAGREDLLGRRMAGASTGDGVLPTRWMD